MVAGRADVIVTDGFTGNVALKLIEGVSQTILGAIRDAARSSGAGQAGGLLLRGALGGFREEIDPETPGGAYLLGPAAPGGRSPRALHPPRLRQRDHARRPGAREDLVGTTQRALEAADALRRPPASAQPVSLPRP